MLSLIERKVVAADQAGIEVNMCGEMAGELCLPILRTGAQTFLNESDKYSPLKNVVRAMNQ